MAWTWRFEDSAGTVLEPAAGTGTGFPSQADAETWLGEVCPELVEAGVDQVVLLEGMRAVYGPMSLHPT